MEEKLLSDAPLSLKRSVGLPPSHRPEAGPHLLSPPADALPQWLRPLPRQLLGFCGLPSNPGGEGIKIWGLLVGNGLREKEGDFQKDLVFPRIC